jgi:O-antigen ligase
MTLKNTKILVPIIIVILYTLEIYRFNFLGVEVRPAELFIIIIGISVLFIVASGARFQFDKVGTLLFIYIIASLMASIRDPQLASFISISYFILIFLAYMLTISLVKTSDDIDILVNTIIIITALISIYTLIEQLSYMFYGYKLTPPFCDYLGLDCVNSTYGFMGNSLRPRAFFLSYNAFGSFALAGLFLAYFKARHYSRFINYLILLVVFVAIVLSQSRNALVGMSLAIFVYLFLKSLIFGKLILFRNLLLMSFIAIAILFLIHYGADYYEWIERMDLIGSLDNLLEPKFIDAELAYYDEANLSLFLTHLLAALEANAETFGLGMGVQQFDYYAVTMNYVSTWGSHSNFVTFLGDSGVIGFAAQVLIIVYLFSLLINVIKASIVNYKISKKINYYDSLFISLFSAYAGVIFTGIVRTYYFNIFTFIIIALLVLIYREGKQSRSKNNTN